MIVKFIIFEYLISANIQFNTQNTVVKSTKTIKNLPNYHPENITKFPVSSITAFRSFTLDTFLVW